VGGACATIYSNNRYQSYDLDYVTFDEMKKVRKALLELGFTQKQKYFQHPNCSWFIEFVSPRFAVGNEFIYNFYTIKTRLGTIKLIHPADSVKDRLASFYHWDDKQALEQAINICLEQKINFREIKRWSEQEKQLEKWECQAKCVNSHK
jgi:hypothetical protein